jgi:hypothetical protein
MGSGDKGGRISYYRREEKEVSQEGLVYLKEKID